MNIAIIGTAGRGDDQAKLTGSHFDRMVTTATQFLDTHGHSADTTALISGGAAWADHIAVALYLQNRVGRLTLALPCQFEHGDINTAAFDDDGSRNFRTNPGGTANYYHQRFSAKTGRNTLRQLAVAISKGAAVLVGNGFFDRNLEVAKADICLAFTFGNGALLKDGGTKHTMDHFLAHQKAKGATKTAYHVDLHTWETFTIN